MSMYVDLSNPKIFHNGRDKYGNGIYHIPPDLPSIDAVQVVRCRDCKHYAGEGKRCDWDICVQVDRFYCYYGERKES